jgi:hypothetical protein
VLKKLLAVLGTLALVLGLVALVAGPASAHNHSFDATCEAGVSVDLTYYSSPQDNPKPNIVTVIVDGKTVVDHLHFGSSYSYSLSPWPTQATSHTARVIVSATDDQNGANNWSFDQTKNVTGCTQPYTPAKVTSTNPYCLGAGTIGDGGYVIPPGQTAVTYQVQTVSGWQDVTAGTHPVAPGTLVHIRAIPSSALYTLTGTTTWDVQIANIDKSTCVVPVAPTSDDSRCTTTAGSSSPASYTIPSVPGDAGYKYYLQGSTTALTAGVVTVSTFPSTIVIVAKTTGDHVFPSNITTSWTFTSSSPGDCHKDVTPAAVVPNPAACTAPGVSSDNGFTITATPGVIYHLSTDSTPLTAGFHSLGSGASSVLIQATAEAHYVLTGQVDWPFTFVAAQDCLIHFPVGDPKFLDGGCDVSGNAVSGTYEVLFADHVHYVATVNGSAPTALVAGVLYSAQPGDVVVITPIVDAGYVITPAILTENLTHTYPTTPVLCKADFIKPSATSQSCVVTELDDSLAKAAATSTLTDAFITIPNTPHVKYYINDVEQTTAGNVVLKPGTYKVSAIAETGYFLQGYNGPWTEVLTSAEPCGQLITHPLVFPLASQHQLGCFANGSYTLSNSIDDAAALTWTVNGSVVSQGTYTVTGPATVTIHAAANGPAYGLADEATTDWTFHFVRPTSCDLTTLALTGSTPTGWIVFGYLLLVSGLALVAVRFARRRESQM